MQTNRATYRFYCTIQTIAVFMFLAFSASAQTKSAKRGIAYGYHSEADMAAISKGVSWWYNWYYQPKSTVSTVLSTKFKTKFQSSECKTDKLLFE